MRIQIEITTNCDIKCFGCDRSCKQAPSKEYMDIKQLEKFCKETIDNKILWKQIDVLGGEPTLHPEFDSIYELFKDFKKKSPDSEILIITNGKSKKAKEIDLYNRDIINVANTSKKSRINQFGTYNIAPIDIEKYTNSDFTKGCYRINDCGFGFTRYGYYQCGAGASIDRVFGFNIGIKKLKEINSEMIQDLCKKLCPLCGHFKTEKEILMDKDYISQTWEKAYHNYKENKPKLILY